MTNKPLNKLLARQIKRKFGGYDQIPEEMLGLMEAINDSYNHHDRDRKLLERAMEKSSEELRFSFEKLVVQNELERKNDKLQEFVSTASHDLKAPLRTIRNFAQLLQLELGEEVSKNAKEFLNFIINGAEGMDELLHSMLSYARSDRQTIEIKPVDLNKVIEKVRRNCFAQIDATKAQIVVHNRLPTIICDANQMTQLFQNLISNAIKFQQKGNQPIIRISSQSNEEQYVFSIQDNGIGIPQDAQQKAFAVFERLNCNYEGTGLGLSICKKVVENLGGKIWLESKVNVGTTFYFSIPISKEAVLLDESPSSQVSCS